MTLFTTKAPGIMADLIRDLSITVEDAAAICGNFGTETGGFAKLQEIKPTVKGSKGGYGWAQWTGPRRRAYEAWCRENGKEPSSDAANYGYVIVELKGAYKHAIVAVKKASGLTAKVKAFEMEYEGAGVKNYASRVKYANAALTAFGTGAPAAALITASPTITVDPNAPITDKETVTKVQQQLREKGYYGVGPMDGELTPKGMTESAILNFRNKNDLPLTPVIDAAFLAKLASAPAIKVDAERATMSTAEVTQASPELAPVLKSNWWDKLVKAILGGLGGLWALASGILGNLGGAVDKLTPVKDFLGDVPPWTWGVLVAVIAGGLYLVSRHTGEQAKTLYNKGIVT